MGYDTNTLKDQLKSIVAKGDEPGHPFRGNQYTDGIGSGEAAPQGSGGTRRISDIAGEIEREWAKQGKGVNYAARPYLDAMRTLGSIKENYYQDSAASVVRYFLANAQSFKGPEAKRIKAELKAMLGGRW